LWRSNKLYKRKCRCRRVCGDTGSLRQRSPWQENCTWSILMSKRDAILTDVDTISLSYLRVPIPGHGHIRKTRKALTYAVRTECWQNRLLSRMRYWPLFCNIHTSFLL
jgi:hypothetical protein